MGCTLELQAQSNVSFVVLYQGDTLYGKVSTDISGHIKRKEKEGGETIKFSQNKKTGQVKPSRLGYSLKIFY